MPKEAIGRWEHSAKPALMVSYGYAGICRVAEFFLKGSLDTRVSRFYEDKSANSTLFAKPGIGLLIAENSNTDREKSRFTPCKTESLARDQRPILRNRSAEHSDSGRCEGDVG